MQSTTGDKTRHHPKWFSGFPIKAYIKNATEYVIVNVVLFYRISITSGQLWHKPAVSGRASELGGLSWHSAGHVGGSVAKCASPSQIEARGAKARAAEPRDPMGSLSTPACFNLDKHNTSVQLLPLSNFPNSRFSLIFRLNSLTSTKEENAADLPLLTAMPLSTLAFHFKEFMVFPVYSNRPNCTLASLPFEYYIGS